MRGKLLAGVLVALIAFVVAGASTAKDRPFSAADLIAMKWGPAPEAKDTGGAAGNTDPGGQFSKEQIERFRCASSGNPAGAVDMSCNTTEYNQDWNPDNEIAVAVNPKNPDHVVAGSNDYFYRFNNSTGARQAIVPTGFFTSIDGGANWVDGQIPLRSGNGAGDPSPAFVGRDSSSDPRQSTVLMAQLENAGGQGGCCVSQGDVAVSRSTDGGFTWSEPITVMKGKGTGIGPANGATFFDKEWLTVNNYPGTPSYGRAVITATRFLNGLQGSYAESPIWMSYSDDGGRTWSEPAEISGSNATYCTYQETGGAAECDEDQFSIPEFGPDGTLYVHFLNGQHEAAWEVDFDFDSQIMVVKAPPTTGRPQFGAPVHAVDLEDGLSDMPYSVIGRQTVWGHQIRWTSAGTISVEPDPLDPDNLTVVWSDRGTPNPNATEECFFSAPGEAPAYDPCNAGPGSDTNVYYATSADGGSTWSGRLTFDAAAGHQWFPWADHKSDGSLAVAWDEDVQAAGGTSPINDQFVHVLKVGTGGGKQPLGPLEQVDVSVTHWAGQYVPESRWPSVCGPVGYSDPPVSDAEGKDCNVFHGDYTGLAVDSLDRVHVVWTGLNRFETSTQRDPYTGGLHDGYAQDAMYARR